MLRKLRKVSCWRVLRASIRRRLSSTRFWEASDRFKVVRLNAEISTEVFVPNRQNENYTIRRGWLRVHPNI